MTVTELTAIVAANNLESNRYQKLPVDTQRQLFGYAVIGRRDYLFDNSSQIVRISRSVCFGTDRDTQRYSYQEFCDCCNNKRRAE